MTEAGVHKGNPKPDIAAMQGITHALHQPRFNIDEAVLVHGASILVRLAVS